MTDDPAKYPTPQQAPRHTSTWRRLQIAMSTGEAVEGVLVRCVRRGYLVQFDDIIGFLPGYHLATLPIVDITPLLNHTDLFKILDCNPQSRRLIVSRRAAYPEPKRDKRSLLERFCVGQHLKGVVGQTVPLGLFVDLGEEVFGLLPQQTSSRPVQRGDIVNVEIVQIRADTERIVLALVPTV